MNEFLQVEITFLLEKMLLFQVKTQLKAQEQLTMLSVIQHIVSSISISMRNDNSRFFSSNIESHSGYKDMACVQNISLDKKANKNQKIFYNMNKQQYALLTTKFQHNGVQLQETSLQDPNKTPQNQFSKAKNTKQLQNTAQTDGKQTKQLKKTNKAQIEMNAQYVKSINDIEQMRKIQMQSKKGNAGHQNNLNSSELRNNKGAYTQNTSILVCDFKDHQKPNKYNEIDCENTELIIPKATPIQNTDKSCCQII